MDGERNIIQYLIQKLLLFMDICIVFASTHVYKYLSAFAIRVGGAVDEAILPSEEPNNLMRPSNVNEKSSPLFILCMMLTISLRSSDESFLNKDLLTGDVICHIRSEAHCH